MTPSTNNDEVRKLAEEIGTLLARGIFELGSEPNSPCNRIQFKGGKWPDNETNQGGIGEAPLAKLISESLEVALRTLAPQPLNEWHESWQTIKEICERPSSQFSDSVKLSICHAEALRVLGVKSFVPSSDKPPLQDREELGKRLLQISGQCGNKTLSTEMFGKAVFEKLMPEIREYWCSIAEQFAASLKGKGGKCVWDAGSLRAGCGFAYCHDFKFCPFCGQPIKEGK